MPVIAIEGLDGSGKSTLAEAIGHRAREAGYEDVRVIHFGPPTFDPDSPLTHGEQEADQMLEIVRDASFLDTFLVLDRFHLGSAAYGPVFRPDKTVGVYGSMSTSEFKRVDRWFKRMGGVLVYADVPIGVALKRLGIRGDEAFLSHDQSERFKQLVAVKKNYETVLETMTCRLGGAVHRGFAKITLLQPEDTEKMADLLTAMALVKSRELADAIGDHEVVNTTPLFRETMTRAS